MTDFLTMQQVADLARVQRPVVSMWRTRHADFPQPETETPATFDAVKVASWLASTRRGNNPDAGIDALIHSSRMDAVRARLDDASALLLLQTLLGEPVVDLDPGRVLEVVVDSGLGDLLPLDTVLAAHSDAELVADVDALVEAGYSGETVLWRLVDSLRRPAEPLAPATLTEGGCRLVGCLLQELTRDASRGVLPHGSEALAVLAQTTGADEGLGTRLSFEATGTAAQPEAVIHRAFAARGDTVVSADEHGARVHLFIKTGASPAEAAAFFADLEQVGQALGRRDVALVLAPAEWLIDVRPPGDPVRAARRAFFNIEEASPPSRDKYVAPLRYAATLPKGLLAYGGRRRLALYVLASSRQEASEAFTTYGDHSGHALDTAECAELAADVMAAIAGEREKHAFLRAGHQRTATLLRGENLATTASVPAPRDGGEALAAAWEAEAAAGGSLAPGVSLESAGLLTPNEPVLWSQVIGTYADVRSGYRVADELCAAPSGAVVIGPGEVRGVRAVGSRRIDRLVVEQAVPHAKFTEPGDVVFVSAGGAAAIVDRRGGSLVQAPARVLRARRADRRNACLAPAVAAFDICAQKGSDIGGWRLHLTPVGQSDGVTRVAASVEARRASLRAQLDALDEYEATVLTGLASGVLRARARGCESADSPQDAGLGARGGSAPAGKGGMK